MATEKICPICEAEFVFAGDEKLGDEIYCSYCGAPFLLGGGKDPDDWVIEEEDG